jgi:hypothetical protein
VIYRKVLRAFTASVDAPLGQRADSLSVVQPEVPVREAESDARKVDVGRRDVLKNFLVLEKTMTRYTELTAYIQHHPRGHPVLWEPIATIVYDKGVFFNALAIELYCGSFEQFDEHRLRHVEMLRQLFDDTVLNT